MNVSTITVGEEEAKQMLAEYRALGDRATDEDKLVQKAMLEASRGHALIDIARAIPAAGADHLGRPHIAIARADDPEIVVWRGSHYYGDAGWIKGTGDLDMRPSDVLSTAARSRLFNFERGELEEWAPMTERWFALTPSIPAALRPRGALSRYHILWEAEWRAKSQLPRPPRDPALLRHIVGTLYAVLAVWDLSEIEQLVLGMVAAEKQGR